VKFSHSLPCEGCSIVRPCRADLAVFGYNESFIPMGAASVGALAGSTLGYYAGGTAGAYVGLLLTPIESGLGDALVNAARGGVIGATIGIGVFGTALAVGAYKAAEHLMNT
jgi:hypothetical protein